MKRRGHPWSITHLETSADIAIFNHIAGKVFRFRLLLAVVADGAAVTFVGTLIVKLAIFDWGEMLGVLGPSAVIVGAAGYVCFHGAEDKARQIFDGSRHEVTVADREYREGTDREHG